MKGQQIEIVEITPSSEMALVRLVTEADVPKEGLVPISILKQIPRLRNSNDIDAGKLKNYEFYTYCIWDLGIVWSQLSFEFEAWVIFDEISYKLAKLW